MAGSALLSSLIPELGISSFLNKETVVSLTVFFTLLCACIVIGHLLEENRWANESITALLLGLCAGVVVLLVSKGQSSQILNFSEELFFIYLLPPIIFNAGFQVKKKQFFRNFSTILSFGAIGTLISFCLISLGAIFILKRIGIASLSTQDYLAVGAILSATDSVCTLQVLSQDKTPLLHSLVFGEGVVNDATSIVLFNAVQTLDMSSINAFLALKLFGTFLYLFFTSTALGIAVGLISAYIIKTLYFGSYGCDYDYVPDASFLKKQLICLLSLSGILTVFFCGIVMSHYTWHNVTESSRITTKHAFATISFIAETFIFLYVGMDAFDVDKWKASHTSCLIGSLHGGFHCRVRYNCCLIITYIVFGSITKPLIEALLFQHSKQSNTDASENQSSEELHISLLENGLLPSEEGGHGTLTRRSSLSLLISYPTSTVHYFWRKFDDRFMRPMFGGRGFVPFVPSSPTGAEEVHSQT
ncbi:sodium/hydrogen exchanger 1-like [Macadamia integrifolia]|uniref:sodium/hydrogen exchanger 1-like n=1 Tax=Macadamia integrifolia TaxID=60698 RepID=UPI001C530181|nr:sodium/hydrogen exchanger 1-like [Macadamia integrifolia]